MCIGASAQDLPPQPPAPPTLADPAVQKARTDAQGKLQDSGLASTSLTINLGGQGQGAKKLAGTR